MMAERKSVADHMTNWISALNHITASRHTSTELAPIVNLLFYSSLQFLSTHTSSSIVDRIFVMSSAFEHHETLYFADGNICLSARPAATRLDGDLNAEAQNSKILVFRVHQGVLSLHSPVFKDMLAFPEPQPGTNEVYDGVPLVQMPDSAEALESLINAFYHG